MSQLWFWAANRDVRAVKISENVNNIITDDMEADSGTFRVVAGQS